MLSAAWLATPIDHALPVVALLVAVIAVTLRRTSWPGAILCGLPLLAGAALAFPDPRHRLLAYGIVFAAVECGALLALREPRYWQCALLALTAIAALRWVARERVEIARELIIVAGALLILAVMRRGAAAVVVAALAAFIAPGVPARTALIPMAVAAVLLVLRASWFVLRGDRRAMSREGQSRDVEPRLAAILAAFALFVPLALFAWSGVAARALPYFFRERPPRARVALNYALRPGQSIEVDVPPDARSLAVSLANGLQLRRGTVAGTIGSQRVRVGDVADWGSMRREVWWRSHNPVPRQPAGIVRGYGYDAWIDGAGTVTLPPRTTRLRITAGAGLPQETRLQIEGFER